ncbi:MAG TPA: DUF4184 family protein [Fibrobacteria bacterium]|nr:DUF4184 family protein [Fibrobacteria bacterium]
MPFTFAHPAAIIPFSGKRPGGGWNEALLIGSVAPDLLRPLLSLERETTHSIPGLAILVVPLTLVFAWFAHTFVTERFRRLPGMATDSEAFSRFLPWNALGGAMIGGLTHLAWDLFTHDPSPLTRMGVLDRTLFMTPAGPFQMGKAMWHLSSAAGVLVLAAWIVARAHRSRQGIRALFSRPWILLATVPMLPFLWLFSNFQQTTGSLAKSIFLHAFYSNAESPHVLLSISVVVGSAIFLLETRPSRPVASDPDPIAGGPGPVPPPHPVDPLARPGKPSWGWDSLVSFCQTWFRSTAHRAYISIFGISTSQQEMKMDPGTDATRTDAARLEKPRQFLVWLGLVAFTMGLAYTAFSTMQSRNWFGGPLEVSRIDPLPPPNLNQVSLREALQNRATHREFAQRPLDLQTLSNLLWAANGVNRPSTGGRTAPSAYDWRYIDIYLADAQGISRYDANRHSLERLGTTDIRALTGMQEFVKDAPLTLILVSDERKIGPKEAEESRAIYSTVAAGAVSQNVYLFCAAEGLHAVVRSSINRHHIHSALKLDPKEKVIVAQTVGFPP